MTDLHDDVYGGLPDTDGREEDEKTEQRTKNRPTASEVPE